MITRVKCGKCNADHYHYSAVADVSWDVDPDAPREGNLITTMGAAMEVPREFFDLLPGQPKRDDHPNGVGPVWVKFITAQQEPSIHVTFFCNEPPLGSESQDEYFGKAH